MVVVNLWSNIDGMIYVEINLGRMEWDWIG